jgi:hypothetical protein
VFSFRLLTLRLEGSRLTLQQRFTLALGFFMSAFIVFLLPPQTASQQNNTIDAFWGPFDFVPAERADGKTLSSILYRTSGRYICNSERALTVLKNSILNI